MASRGREFQARFLEGNPFRRNGLPKKPGSENRGTEEALPSGVADPSRILMIRPSALGDVCRTVPCLVSLRRRYPEATIDWLVNAPFAPAVSAHPALSGVVPFDRASASVRGIVKGTGWFRGMMADLRARRYDLVIDLQGLARSGLFAWGTKAPRRVGFANARELGWIGVNERHHVDAGMHTVDRMLRLLDLAGVPPVLDMRLHVAPAWREEVPGVLRGRRYAVLAPTSRWEGKRWPIERFAALVPRVLECGYDAVAVVGSMGERAQCGPVLELATREPSRVVDLLGATSVGGLMAVIEGSALVVANDSASLHMAVGFDKPLVALFGPTRVGLVGPFRREADVIQHAEPGDRFEHKDSESGFAMMRRISVEEVVAAVRARS
jgi:heptosyltransferase I